MLEMEVQDPEPSIFLLPISQDSNSCFPGFPISRIPDFHLPYLCRA